MDRSKLLIGAYYYDKALYDQAHMARLAEAGIEFIVGVPADEELLELCRKFGVKIIATSNFPLWWGGTGETGGTYCQKLTLPMMDEIAAGYKKHPAIWGDYPVDEPNLKDFDYIGKVLSRYEELLPGQLPFINLHPYYEDVRCTQWLGCPYRQYADFYLEKIKNDYIAFDIYPFSHELYRTTYLYGLDIISEACRKSGRDLWVIIQSGAWKAEDILSGFQIRWQCMVALAYGARVIMHASYSPGWWDETTSCADKSGNENVTYGYVKEVNRELRDISDIYMKYRSAGVFVSGDPDSAPDYLAAQLKEQDRINRELYNRAAPEAVRMIKSRDPLLCGYFLDAEGGEGLFIVNMKDPYDKEAAAEFNIDAGGKYGGIKFYDGEGGAAVASGGGYIYKLNSGGGVFVTLG